MVLTYAVLHKGSGFSPALRLSAAGSDNQIGEALGNQLDAEKAAKRPARLVLFAHLCEGCKATISGISQNDLSRVNAQKS